MRGAVPAVVALAALTGCQTTQELSAQRARQAKKLVRQRGLHVSRRNPDVKVVQTAVVHDANGAAAVVELRNTGPRGQAGLPVAITVRDRRGRPVYRNDAGGLDASLVSLPLLARGRRAFWVNTQVVGNGTPARVRARVGRPRATAPRAVPRFTLTGVHLTTDGGGWYAKGRIVNRSRVAQRRLTVFGVAHRGRRIVAAGVAVVDRLAAAGGRPAPFTVFFIGNPKGARIELDAPPTVLR